MENLLNDPLIQSALLPLSVSLILAAALGFTSDTTRVIAGVAVAVSALIAIIAISGLSFPPQATSQKLPYLIVAAGVLGVLVDLRGNRIIYRLSGLVMLLTMVIWLFGSRLGAAGWPEYLYLIVITLLAFAALWCGERQPRQIDTGIKLLFFSAGLGAILLIGSSAMLAQTAFALMAATGGFLLWNWPTFRFTIGASLLLPMVTILSAMSAQSLFFTQASGIALALLIPLLFIDRIMPHVPLLNRANTPTTRALSLGAIAVTLLPIAIGSAFLLTETSGYGY